MSAIAKSPLIPIQDIILCNAVNESTSVTEAPSTTPSATRPIKLTLQIPDPIKEVNGTLKSRVHALKQDDVGRTASKQSCTGKVSISSIKSALQSSEGAVGRGGFGVVMKATYKGHEVAVKSLTADAKQGDILGAAQIFLSEAKKMSQLSHARIVKFHGFILETCSIVMEYMPMGSLHDYIQIHDQFAWSDRYFIAQDIAEGMAYLHAKVTPDGKKKPDVFHQDLKSDNVLLCIEGQRLRAKISDFGLSTMRMAQQGALLDVCFTPTSAKSHNGSDSIVQDSILSDTHLSTQPMEAYMTSMGTSTEEGLVSPVISTSAQVKRLEEEEDQGRRVSKTGSYVAHAGGTQIYMAPELASSKKFTKKCDVYAYGIIVLELVLLDEPAVCLGIYHDHYEDIKAPDVFVTLMRRCLKSNPKKRPTFSTIFKFFIDSQEAKKGIEGAFDDQEDAHQHKYASHIIDIGSEIKYSTSLVGPVESPVEKDAQHRLPYTMQVSYVSTSSDENKGIQKLWRFDTQKTRTTTTTQRHVFWHSKKTVLGLSIFIVLLIIILVAVLLLFVLRPT